MALPPQHDHVLAAPSPSSSGGRAPDRPPVCPVCQQPVAKGRVEPVFPTAQPPLRVILRVQGFRG